MKSSAPKLFNAYCETGFVMIKSNGLLRIFTMMRLAIYTTNSYFAHFEEDIGL